MDNDKVVCYCQNVTNGMVKDAVMDGASTLEEVQEATGAGTVCGACIDNVQHLIDQFVKERDEQ
ncbi:MAG: (2Fe-2S)-binding protein [Eubacteriales bacterium]|nr:(2Fe-2S)-binding protein [Eubacteriales bacterium]